MSYARSDRDLAQKIGQELSEAGLDVCDPETRILPGANSTNELKAALDSAGALAVFISPEAMVSRSVSYEIEHAFGAKHLRGRLIPSIRGAQQWHDEIGTALKHCDWFLLILGVISTRRVKGFFRSGTSNTTARKRIARRSVR